MADRPVLSVSEKAMPRADVLRNAELRRHCDRRAREMMASRTDIDPVIDEISSLTQPTRSRFMPISGSRGGANAARRRRAPSNMLKDGHGTYASGVLTNGLNSGLSSPSRPWFRLKVEDTDLANSFAVKLWIGQVEQITYAFLQQTNFYEAAQVGYGELGLFGTEACFLDSHWRSGMVSHPLSFGEYWIAEGDDTRVDTLLRLVPMTVHQIVQRFVADRFDSKVLHWDRVSATIKDAYDQGREHQVFELLHLVEANPAWEHGRLGLDGKPWRSIYWDPKSDKVDQLIGVDGCYEQPFYAARWNRVGGGDPWGYGPGWEALADLRALQLAAKKSGDGADLALRPPLMGPSRVKVKMQPGSYTAASDVDAGTVKALWQVDYRALQVVRDDRRDLYEKINQHFSVDLFLAISQMDGVQPRNNEEIFSRNEEKLTQLGPVIGRVNTEKLGKAVDRTFGICSRMGLYPPAPEELHGIELMVDFVSILAQAQRAAGLGTLERSLGFIGNMAGAFGEIVDNIDYDAVSRQYWERSGAPVEGLRDPSEVQRIRAQRAQAAQMQQMRESAPAVRDLAGAGAELLAQTDTSRADNPLLTAVLG